MSRAYDYYIHTQLEPDDRIIVGNAKRFNDERKVINDVQPPENRVSDEELARREDEFLKEHGIS